MVEQHRQIRLLMVLVYIAFGFAFRITMVPASQLDPHKPDLSGDLMMNYDVVAEIIGARSIIDGSFDMYVGKYSKDVVPPGGVALPYPPLLAYVQVPVVFIGSRLGLEPFGTTMLMICGLPYIVLGGLLALQAGNVLRKSLKVTDEMTITLVVFLILFSSLMFWVVTYAARFELVAPLFLLLAMSALADEKYAWAGIALGLSLMTKLTTLPAVFVFAAVILLGVLEQEIPAKKALRLFITLPVPFMILLPFLIAHPRALWSGLFVTPSLLPIMDVSFVNLVLQAGKHVFEEGALREFLKLHSNIVILILCLGFILATVKRKNVKLGTSRFCALVAMASFFLPILAKYTYIDKYTAVASVFVILWGASQRPGFPHEAVWFVIIQSFILDHMPVIWKKYVGLIFYAIVFAYMYYFAFASRESVSEAGEFSESQHEKLPV